MGNKERRSASLSPKSGKSTHNIQCYKNPKKVLIILTVETIVDRHRVECGPSGRRISRRPPARHGERQRRWNHGNHDDTWEELHHNIPGNQPKYSSQREMRPPASPGEMMTVRTEEGRKHIGILGTHFEGRSGKERQISGSKNGEVGRPRKRVNGTHTSAVPT